MALVLDLADPQELVGYVRGIQMEEERNRFVLANYLPNDNIDEIEWRVTTGDLTQPEAATVRAWDTESPIASRQGLKRIMGELPPISRKMKLGEEERLRKRALERGNNSQLVDAIYDDAATLTRAVLARIEMFRGEVLQKGTITINENGVLQTVDFGRRAAHTVTAATKWDSTGDPVADLRTWVQTYIDNNGVAPEFILTSTQVISTMLTNQKVRDLVNVGLGAPGIVTIQALQTILSAFGLPPLVPYDVSVRVGGASTKVMNPKQITLMPPAGEPLGKTFFGTTAESLELQEAQIIGGAEAPGMISTVHKLDDPVSIWTKVGAIALPTLINPDLTFTATVLT